MSLSVLLEANPKMVPAMLGGIALLIAAVAAVLAVVFWWQRKQAQSADGERENLPPSVLDGAATGRTEETTPTVEETGCADGDKAGDGQGTLIGVTAPEAWQDVPPMVAGNAPGPEEALQAARQKALREQRALKEKIKKLEEELDDKERLIRHREESLKNLRDELAQQSAKLEQMTAALTEAEKSGVGATAKLEKRLAEQEAENRSLDGRLVEANKRKNALEKVISDALEVLGNTYDATSVEYLLQKIKGVARELNRILNEED